MRDSDRHSKVVRQSNRKVDWIHAFMEYDDIYPPDTYSQSTIDTIINKIDTLNLCRALAIMNYYLWTKEEGPRPPRGVREEKITRHIFNLKDREKIKRILKQQPETILFPRQQILSLMARRIQLSDAGDSVSFNESNIQQLGKVLFAVSSSMQRTEEAVSSRRSPQANEELIAHLFRLQRDSERPITVARDFSRYWYLYFKMQNNIPNEFNSHLNLDLKTFMLFCFSLRAHFRPDNDLFGHPNNFNIGPTYFSKMKMEFRTKVNDGFELISSTVSEFRHEYEKCAQPVYYGFSPFWRNPVLKVKDEVYFILDQQFLDEKLTTGMWWMLHDFYIEHGMEAERLSLKRKWGGVVEQYVGQLLEDACVRVADLKSTDLSDKQGRVDATLENSSTRVYIETTVERMNLMRILSGEKSALAEESERVLFDRKGNRGKMTQLADECSKDSSGKKLYSIIVTEESFPELGRWYDIIEERYTTAHGKDAPTGFMILTLGDVEDLLSLAIKGQSLDNILTSLYNGVRRGVPFTNMLRSLEPEMHPLLDETYKEFGKETKRALFGWKTI